MESAPAGHRSLSLTEWLSRIEQAREAMGLVRYKDWTFEVVADGGFAYLQLKWVAPDSETGEMAVQRSRKWRLSPWMTRSELVQTAFPAVKVAEEHEIRETFRYKGKPVFGPHFDVEVLAMALEFADAKEVRPPVGSIL